MLKDKENLDKPVIEGHVRKECTIIEDTLSQYSALVLESEWDHIRELKLQIDTVVQKMNKNKKDLHRISQ